MKPEKVRHQLGKLPEPIRAEALEAYRDFPRTDIYIPTEDFLEDAICNIHWQKTKQGKAYWQKLRDRAERGEFDIPAQHVTSESLSNDFFNGKITGHQMLEGAALLDAKPPIDRELYSPDLSGDLDASITIHAGTEKLEIKAGDRVYIANSIMIVTERMGVHIDAIDESGVKHTVDIGQCERVIEEFDEENKLGSFTEFVPALQQSCLIPMKCPCCQASVPLDDEIYMDGDELENECDNCGFEFYSTAIVSITAKVHIEQEKIDAYKLKMQEDKMDSYIFVLEFGEGADKPGMPCTYRVRSGNMDVLKECCNYALENPDKKQANILTTCLTGGIDGHSITLHPFDRNVTLPPIPEGTRLVRFDPI